MLSNDENRPYFCFRALAGEMDGGSTKMENVLIFLENARREPYRAMEFEESAEITLRNNGYDPNHDKGWKRAGVKDGRAGAIHEIRQAYFASIAENLNHMAIDVKVNQYDYIPSALSRNPIDFIVSSLKRAHLGKDVEFLVSDEAWQPAGYTGIEEFHQVIRDMFVEAGVGGYLAHDLKLDGNFSPKDLAEKAADFAIQRAFPQLATKLGIPESLALEVLPRRSEAATAFGQARDFTHS